MWKAAALAVGLLIALVGPSQATEGHPIYGVKLCGREFIRAVIFTCGGSRWKRSLGMPGTMSTVGVIYCEYSLLSKEPIFMTTCILYDSALYFVLSHFYLKSKLSLIGQCQVSWKASLSPLMTLTAQTDGTLTQQLVVHTNT